MFENLNDELTSVKEKIRQKQKWEDHLVRAEKLLQDEQNKRKSYYNLLMKEKAQVEKLKNFSLANLLYSFQGSKEKKLREGKQEIEAANLKYQEADETIKDLEAEIQEYKHLIKPLHGSRKAYQELLIKKEQLIKDSNSVWSDELFQLADEESEIHVMMNEYKEAISAGRNAQRGLSEALQSLNKAKSWSTFDMFGGGMITTHIKHSHLDDAKDDIHQVQRQLRHFQEELMDLKEHFHIDLEIGNMLTFADYFFDGLLVDWMVHGKINDAMEQTETMLYRTNETINRLQNDLNNLEKKLSNINKKKQVLIENV